MSYCVFLGVLYEVGVRCMCLYRKKTQDDHVVTVPIVPVQEEATKLSSENKMLQSHLAMLTEEIGKVEKENRAMKLKLLLMHLAQNGNLPPSMEQLRHGSPHPQSHHRSSQHYNTSHPHTGRMVTQDHHARPLHHHQTPRKGQPQQQRSSKVIALHMLRNRNWQKQQQQKAASEIMLHIVHGWC
jgi:hypothetical protein